MRQQLGPSGHCCHHFDVIGGAPDPLGQRPQQHPVVINKG